MPIIPIFSTAYFPPIDYMATMLHYSEVQIEVHETYPKQTYRNRTLIMTASGIRPLTVPISRPNGNHTTTANIEIAHSEPWNIVHLRTLCAAYKASPYFMHYYDDLSSLILADYKHLVDLNKALVLWVLRCLKAPCHIEFTPSYAPQCTPPADYRNCFSPKKPAYITSMPSYYQVFADRQPFAPNLSILDLLMNLGPEAYSYLCHLTLPQ